ncbi:ROK family protein [Kriegella aquimaris]|nr:ROK family protein [Kriegella aquimaris]
MKNMESKDPSIVMTLDAGGTNFIFSAIQENKPIIEPIRLEPNSHDLAKCLESITSGFELVKKALPTTPAAISFAFPGPADYPRGIIGDLPNLSAFRGGVALGPMLEHHFNIPVYINNDGNLFTYGEALSGLLPELNDSLKKANNLKRFKNLIGITLGTGFGVGLVSNNQIITGDNSNGGEGWLLRDFINADSYVEEHLSREGIRRSYALKAGTPLEKVGMPADIYHIAKRKAPGNQEAAMATFNDFGTVLGEALATLVAIIDGVVVLGGGVSAAFDLFAPAMFQQMQSKFQLADGNTAVRLPQQVFNLEDPEQKQKLLEGNQKEIAIPNTDKKITYDSMLRTGVGVSKNDTAAMIALGAYAYALKKLHT